MYLLKAGPTQDGTNLNYQLIRNARELTWSLVLAYISHYHLHMVPRDPKFNISKLITMLGTMRSNY